MQILRALADWCPYNHHILEPFLNHEAHEIERKEPQNKTRQDCFPEPSLFPLGPIKFYTNKAASYFGSFGIGTHLLGEWSQPSRTVCLILNSLFIHIPVPLFFIPVSHLMISEYLMLIKSISEQDTNVVLSPSLACIA